MKDVNGTEIEVGMKVRHIHPSAVEKPGGGLAFLSDGPCLNNWAKETTARVVALPDGSVETTKVSQSHIPFHVPSFLEVVS